MGIRDWFRARPDEDREIREEITFHVDRATQENMARGMGEAEARAEALRRFGDLERVRRECLSARGRRVPAVLGWSAVGLLAAVSFLSGMAVQGRSSTPLGIRNGSLNVVYSTARSTPPHGLRFPIGAIVTEGVLLERSPFKEWRWRDGIPEVTIDGRLWMQVLSVNDVEAAALREGARKAAGLPEGTYRDVDPYDAARAMGKIVGPNTRIRMKSLDGGNTEVIYVISGSGSLSRVHFRLAPDGTVVPRAEGERR